jgi:hypothetical protein
VSKTQHDIVRDKATNLISGESSDYSIPETNASGIPDIRVNDAEFLSSSEFSEVWVEVETTTIAKPGYIVQRVHNAALNDAKLIFGVPARENDSRDYYAQRIDTIIGPPELVHKKIDENRYKLYTGSDHTRLKNEDGFALIPSDSSGNWILEEKRSSLRYEYESGVVEIENQDDSIEARRESLDNYITNSEDGYTLHREGETNSVDTLADLKHYQRIPKPIYPFDVPRTRLDKIIDNTEYLVFGENVVYRREHPTCDIYDIGA